MYEPKYAVLNDIRPSFAEGQKKRREDSAILGEFFKSKLAEFKSVSCCPACGSSEAADEITHDNGPKYKRCAACDMLYLTPRPLPRHFDEYRHKAAEASYYAKVVFPSTDAARIEKIYRPRIDAFRRLVTEADPSLLLEGASYVEIGAGHGRFAEMMKRELGMDVTVVEPNPHLAESCRAFGLRTIEKMMEDIATDELHADIAASFECIEHITDPSLFLANMRGMLPDGGILCLTTPNGMGLDVVELRGKSTTLGWDHQNLFSKKSMKIFLERCGFEMLAFSTPGILDVDLLKEARFNGDLEPEHGSFYDRLTEDDGELAADFQRFIVDHELSSHMMVVARKK